MRFDVFSLNDAVLDSYQTFARSFTKVRSADIAAQVEQLYADQSLWPEPLLSLNPHFKGGKSVTELTGDGGLHPDCAKIFTIDGTPLPLHRHQEQAIGKALDGRSFVVTTGTGSGKSLCYFIPIIDSVLKAKKIGAKPSTKAIVIYPMNALANSQREELNKFLDGQDVSYRRFTGQEDETERRRIANDPPDILLTNFMMLELLMTRQGEIEQKVIANCRGLRFIVLDELHTYRGRQGADVAMLMRRLRARTEHDATPICIGTSATMASEGGEEGRNRAVADVAAKLFGTRIDHTDVMTETLRRVTDVYRTADEGLPGLAEAVRRAAEGSYFEGRSNDELANDDLAIWIETRLGLKNLEIKAERATPQTMEQATKLLAEDSGEPEDICRDSLVEALRALSLPERDRGVPSGSDSPLFAFKLHQFISGAGSLYATLHGEGERRVTLDGQLFHPEEDDARLFTTHFCRGCGQEFHPVTRLDDEDGERFIRRAIDDVPLRGEEDGQEVPDWGFLMPEPSGEDFKFTGRDEDYPEAWLEESRDGIRLKRTYRKSQAVLKSVLPNGFCGSGGRRTWFTPGRFRFCPNCREHHSDSTRDINRLAALSAEGRSSATTVLMSAALDWMNGSADLDEHIRKMLTFTDNRQDAALQAGHFNDFVFVTLLRGAILAALDAAGDEGVAQEEIGQAVQRAIGFVAANMKRRGEWLFEPELKGANLTIAEKSMREALAYRFWVDQRRGWRFTNPNLEQLGLIEADYLSLDELVEDDAAFESDPLLANASREERRGALIELLDHMRRGLAVECDALDRIRLESLAGRMRGVVRPPWTLDDQQDSLLSSTVLVLDAPTRRELKPGDEALILRAGPQSLLGRALRRMTFGGVRPGTKQVAGMTRTLLEACTTYGLANATPSPVGGEGWRLQGAALLFRRREPDDETHRRNVFFQGLYEHVARPLASGGEAIFGYEAREHTAQVDALRREIREARFRFTPEDKSYLGGKEAELKELREDGGFLPVLVCSPTMELGVDISSMNVVYLRNVPPTPANYAQRSGRGGRSGQAALVLTYCAAQSPHDQYYFKEPRAMVSGIVRPPTIDLQGRDLVESHVHAEWLAASGIALDASIADNLEMSETRWPVRHAITEKARSEETSTAAYAAAVAVLKRLDDDFREGAPVWFAGADNFAREVVKSAPGQFEAAFDRWRDLLEAAERQIEEARRMMDDYQASSRDRKAAEIRHRHGNRQRELLLGGKESFGSDFYTYRYLATEGFLPGYNFPRLPLMAFVPGDALGGKERYIQRARFLAISEFGPGSLLYHEGRAYRVNRALLREVGGGAEGGLPTFSTWVCSRCGAAHDGEPPEKCHACAEPMSEADLVKELYRVENVATRPVERITANDEERRRQGFEIQTTFSFSKCTETAEQVFNAEQALLTASYGSAALVRRINKGLRRRRDPREVGFLIDPRTGMWRGATDEEENGDPERIVQRITPVVEDRKNALLLRIHPRVLHRWGEDVTATMATIQHALSRGIGQVFQLEEGEVQTEPMPSRGDRRGLFIYEAAEGGAGALSRLLREPETMREVAASALEMMHYDRASFDVAHRDGPQRLDDRAADECVAGCYRCLLSYYNQPDHELIDRRDEHGLAFLLALAASTGPAGGANTGPGEDPPFPKGPPPDSKPAEICGVTVKMIWRAHRVCAIEAEEAPEGFEEAAAAMGFDGVILPAEPGARIAALQDLARLLGIGRSA